MKVPDSTGALSAGRGGVVINWFVEDVETSAELIKKAGGKIISEKEKEGECGLYRYFEDTEGNVGAVYMMVKK
jgi:predicted enzyme related to lactoylglutathione lyase